MEERVPISNIVRIDSINNFKKATLVYKNNDNTLCEISFKLAERGWLKEHPNKSFIDRLSYMSGGIHYVADRCNILEAHVCRTLTFFLQDSHIMFYSDITNEVKFTQTLNLLHSNNWGTLKVDS